MTITKKISFNREKIIEYFLSILFVYCNGSYLIFNYKTVMIVLLILSLSLYVVYRAKFYSDFVYPNFIVFFLAFFPLVTCLFNINHDVNLVSVINNSITYLLLGCLHVDRLKSLLNKYVNVIYFLAFVTIILNSLFLAVPQVLNLFTVKPSANFVPDEFGFYNFYIYTLRISGGIRAQGIFWEPGAWSINEAFALFWVLFITKDSKKIIVLIISIFLTFSTSGIFLAVILLFTSLALGRERKLKMKIIKILVVVIAGITAVSIYANAKFDIDIGQELYNQIIGKLSGDSAASKNEVLSYEDRAQSTRKAFVMAMDNPIFGVGKAKEENKLFVTSSLAEIGYQLGLIYLFIYVLLFRIIFKPLGLFISIIFCLIMMNGEAYAFLILSSLTLVYGAKEAVMISPATRKLFFNSSVLSKDGA